MERRSSSENYISTVVHQLVSELGASGLRGQVSGRPKHLCSIWRKMRNADVEFADFHDVWAVRILVGTVTDCCAALGMVHTLWPHIPKEFNDYITNPKSNMYQSLHTAVTGPTGQTLEVQIRTHDMHEHAQFGVAAHWQYKESSPNAKADNTLREKVAWL